MSIDGKGFIVKLFAVTTLATLVQTVTSAKNFSSFMWSMVVTFGIFLLKYFLDDLFLGEKSKQQQTIVLCLDSIVWISLLIVATTMEESTSRICLWIWVISLTVASFSLILSRHHKRKTWIFQNAILGALIVSSIYADRFGKFWGILRFALPFTALSMIAYSFHLWLENGRLEYGPSKKGLVRIDADGPAIDQQQIDDANMSQKTGRCISIVATASSVNVGIELSDDEIKTEINF